MPALFPFLLLLLSPVFHQTLIPVNADADLILKTCNSTNYKYLCLTTINADPNSLQADIKTLAAIIINAASAAVADTSSYLQLLLDGAKGAVLKTVLNECIDGYGNAGSALGYAIKRLDSEEYEYASVDLQGAQDYPNSCHETFKQKREIEYPGELASREEMVEDLCLVGIEIINLIV